ncbi:hypothetical protein [Microbulbifer sp. PSTR4-B]|uniref:hypothetical protein n=1 Tax=Microbulbifer sp. PSTR4-B TaxID=3243396 RepID=UPI00403A0C03
MKILYVHIGTHKTGSSSIQRFFSANDSTFLRVFGLLYPKTGRSTGGSHHHLAWEAAGDSRYSARHGSWKALKNELSTTSWETAMLSCEAFSAYSDDSIMTTHITEIANSLRCDVQPILFVRPQETYFESQYCEGAKGGGLVDSFSHFVMKELENPRYDYCKVADAWGKAFQSPIVITYEKGVDSVREICNAMHLDQEALTQHTNPAERANDRVGATALSIILACTRAGRTLGMTKQDTRSVAANLLKSLSGHDTPARSLDEITAAMIRDQFAESNHHLARKYFGRDALFQDHYRTNENKFGGSTLMDEATIAHLEAAFRCIMKRKDQTTQPGS